MEIKNSNRRQTIECPEQKLKFFSYIEELQSTLLLIPLTPQRNNKNWIVDPWQNQYQHRYSSPQKNNYINKIVEKYENKAFRLRKVEIHSEKIVKSKMETPVNQQKQNSLEKENRPRSRLYSITKPLKKVGDKKEIQQGPFKIAVESVIYPVLKEGVSKKKDDKMRRIQRFHSFVARSIRK